MEFTKSPLDAHFSSIRNEMLVPNFVPPTIPIAPQHHQNVNSFPPLQGFSDLNHIGDTPSGRTPSKAEVLAEIDELCTTLPPLRVFSTDSAWKPLSKAEVLAEIDELCTTLPPLRVFSTDSAWKPLSKAEVLSEIDQLCKILPPIRVFSTRAEPPSVAQLAPGPSDPSFHDQKHRKSAENTTKPPVTKMQKRYSPRQNVETRRIKLQNDEFVESFGETWVVCSGCRRRITLDSRDGARYYIQNFSRHKLLCGEVKEGMSAARRREVEEGMRSGP